MKDVMLFIDGTTLYYDWKDTAPKDKKMDLEKLIATIISRRKDYVLKRCYYYTTKLDKKYSPTESANQDNFIAKLKHIPRLDIRFGHLQQKHTSITPSKNQVQCNHCSKPITATLTTYVDKGTDVNLAIDMLSYAYKNNYSVALILSRDADFVKAVKEVKELGKDVELVIFEGSKNRARELWEAVDDWIILNADDCKKASLP